MSESSSARDGITGRARDAAHLYQQSQGIQVNAERFYFGNERSLEDLLPTHADWSPEDWPTVSEWDPLDLGVHRAPVSDGNAVPVYVERDADVDILRCVEATVRDGGMTIIVGDSTAGKTRSAYQALGAMAPDRRLFRPESSKEFGSVVLGILSSPSPWAIWLDDLERFLIPGGLNPGLLVRLKRRGISCVATIRGEQYRRFERQSDNIDSHEMTDFRRLIDQSNLVHLARKWTGSEIARAASSGDTRIRDALPHGQLFGIAEYLAAGPLLRNQWALAWDVGANPRGASLVAAAVDCARAGVDVPIPVDILQDLHLYYLDKAGGDLLSPESVEHGISWATRKRLGVTSLLIPSANGTRVRAFEYLADATARDSTSESIPQSIWRDMTEFAWDDSGLLFSIAYAANLQGQQKIEIACWTRIASLTEDADDFVTLGRILQAAEQLDEAVLWYEKAAGSGSSEGHTQLGIHFQSTRDSEKAEQHLRVAVNAGNGHAMLHLAFLLQDQKNLDESEYWYRRAREMRDDQDTTAGLASILAHKGLNDEADVLFRELIEGASDDDNFNGIGITLARAGRSDAAVDFWERAISRGDGDAAANLARHAEDQSDYSRAEELWRISRSLGRDEAVLGLADLLAKHGSRNEANALYLTALEDEVEDAEYSYAAFLYNNKDFASALDHAERAYELSGDRAGPAYLLAVTHERLGASTEFERWLTVAADANHKTAQARLGHLYSDREEYEAAVHRLRPASKAGDEQSACELGFALIKLERFEEAWYWLEQSFQLGHAHAACLHGWALLKNHEPEAGVAKYKMAARGGHLHAAEVLIGLFRTIGQFNESAYWLRFLNNGGAPPERKTKQRPNKKRRRR